MRNCQQGFSDDKNKKKEQNSLMADKKEAERRMRIKFIKKLFKERVKNRMPSNTYMFKI